MNNPDKGETVKPCMDDYTYKYNMMEVLES